MKSWCDLSWREKQKIEGGDVNSFNYSEGYSFQVKQKVQEGIEKTNEKKNQSQSVQ
jgi:predicted 3-demethylubiquinone-9 3-methyltransferase (glyoxalase superfamily)